MKLVIIESPYAASSTHTVEEHIKYARLCVKDSLSRGEAPIASHLLYTQEGILDDTIPAKRKQGIDAGLAWRVTAKCSVVYTDMGVSKGMEYGTKAALDSGNFVEYRKLFKGNK